jgi:hypothetical protein
MIHMIGGVAAPTPEESTERSLREVLKGLDTLLDVKWIPTAMYNERDCRWEGRYALTVDWPSADKRWSMVQSGEVPPDMAHDIVGWLCTDMSEPKSVPTSPDGIENRVLELLGSMDNTRYPWKQRFLSTIEKNKKFRQDVKSEILDQTADEAEYQYRAAKHIPQVTGANFDSKGNLLK